MLTLYFSFQLQTSLTNVVGSGKYRVCSFGDWVVHYALALDCQRSGAKLPESLKSNFVNILDLHYDQNPAGPHAANIDELLKANELELSATAATELKAKTDGASLVRILNRMIRSHLAKFDGMAATNESTEESKTEVKKDRSRSRSRDKEESTTGKYFEIFFANSLFAAARFLPNLLNQTITGIFELSEILRPI